MDAYSLELLSRAGDDVGAPAPRSPRLADAVVEPPRRPVPGARSFELPRGVFVAMGCAYAAFLVEMAVAFGTGTGMPLLLAVCAVYLAVYLGTPAVFGAVRTGAAAPKPSFARLRSRGLDTLVGRMGVGAVIGQVLIVPACVAGFGLAVLVVVATL